MFDCGGNGECARIHLAITSDLCVVSDKKSQRDGQMRQAKIKILNKTKHKVIFFLWISVTNFSLSLSFCNHWHYSGSSPWKKPRPHFAKLEH